MGKTITLVYIKSIFLLMNKKQFTRFLDKIKLDDMSGLDKVSEFIKWCNNNNLEEVILRLSSEKKGGISNNYFLDFTTRRIIIRNKHLLRKFLDMGYVAGLAPLPMVILEKDIKEKTITNAISFSSKLLKDIDSFINYSDIEEFVFRKGIDNTIVNMFGKMVVANHITINTNDSSYKFTLPVNKNSKYELILPWLQLVLPIKIKST